LAALSHQLNAFECYEYKRHYDEGYLAHDWQSLEHFVIVLQNQPPSIAVSSTAHL